MSRSHHQSPHRKLKPPPRTLFSCSIFRNCTQSVLSPTNPPTPDPPHPSPPPPPAAAQPTSSPPPPSPTPPPPPFDNPPDRPLPSSSSSSSSSSTSQSFTQWRFPLQHHHQQHPLERRPESNSGAADAFRAAEQYFASGARLPALRLLERALAPSPSPPDVPCTQEVMAGVVAALRDPATARPAAKVLLALLLSEHNRPAASAAGAASAAVEAVAASGPGGATAERALAALELLCTVAEGADEVRAHPAASAALAAAVEGMVGRGRECGIGVMAAIYGGTGQPAAPPEIGRAVVAAMQGECSARGRRKGAQLLRALQSSGQLDVATDGL